jgi:hypothetical protein
VRKLVEFLTFFYYYPLKKDRILSEFIISDQRKGERLESRFKLLHALFEFPNLFNPRMVTGEIINISSTGTLFHSPFFYKIDSIVRLEIKLGSWERYGEGFSSVYDFYHNQPFIALGKVLRCDSVEKDNDPKIYMTAVQFISVDEGHQHAVAKFIEKINRKKKEYV